MSRLSHSLNKMREVVETELEEHIAITTKNDFSAAIKAKREMSRDFTLLDGKNFKEANNNPPIITAQIPNQIK